MAQPSISEILKRLMFEKDIKAMDLARKTNLPQPTIQRIVSGTTPNPHLTSLTPIAEFFNVSIEQLKGSQPIPWLEPKKEIPGMMQIPIISSKEAAVWPEIKTKYKTRELTTSVWVEDKISMESFALILQDAAMYPLFSKGTLIIVDPTRQPKDRSYVVIALKDHAEVIFRQLIIDVDHFYLKSLSPDLESFPMLHLKKEDQICGIMVQARKNYDDES